VSPRISPETLVGTELAGSGGRWAITQYLASGGIAHVYLARPLGEGPRKIVALKLLRPELDDRRDATTRFEREAVAALRVAHENVVEVLEDVQRSGGLTFFSIEHLVGVDLADLLASQKRLPPPRAVRIVAAVARGLAAAHAAGVIHRDIKPENIFLVHSTDGREIPKVLDFGSAWFEGDAGAPSHKQRITVSTGFVGTPGYLAPEQAEGVVANPTADVYSLGVVLFEALTGSAPFRGRSWVEVVHLHATAPLPRVAEVSPALESLVHQAMAKRPEDRFPSMNSMVTALLRTPEGTKA
jgi:serine/threonine protein kinase